MTKSFPSRSYKTHPCSRSRVSNFSISRWAFLRSRVARICPAESSMLSVTAFALLSTSSMSRSWMERAWKKPKTAKAAETTIKMGKMNNRTLFTRRTSFVCREAKPLRVAGCELLIGKRGYRKGRCPCRARKAERPACRIGPPNGQSLGQGPRSSGNLQGDSAGTSGNGQLGEETIDRADINRIRDTPCGRTAEESLNFIIIAFHRKIKLMPKSTTNFQQILADRGFADNYPSPHCTIMITAYAVNS